MEHFVKPNSLKTAEMLRHVLIGKNSYAGPSYILLTLLSLSTLSLPEKEVTGYTIIDFTHYVLIKKSAMHILLVY